MPDFKYAVLGHPIHHSKSPLIHSHWFKEYNIDGHYHAIDIQPDHLSKDLRHLIAQGYKGFNVTLPHKETIMALCDYVDDTARMIGAVNTIKIQDHKIIGYNTDIYGAIKNIQLKHPDPNFSLAGQSICVLGAGGAARAILSGLAQEKVTKIYLANRTRAKAENLTSIAPDIIEVIDWEDKEDILPYCHGVINTTSLGMINQPALEIDISAFPTKGWVNDIVYNPLMTPLLMAAQNNGNAVITGIGMLLYQAALSFELWTGLMPIVTDDLTQKVLDA